MTTFRRVSPCCHGKRHGVTHLPTGTGFSVPGCHDTRGVPRSHVADEAYPVEDLPPEPRLPRQTRSDKGVKRGPHKVA